MEEEKKKEEEKRKKIEQNYINAYFFNFNYIPKSHPSLEYLEKIYDSVFIDRFSVDSLYRPIKEPKGFIFIKKSCSLWIYSNDRYYQFNLEKVELNIIPKEENCIEKYFDEGWIIISKSYLMEQLLDFFYQYIPQEDKDEKKKE